MVESRSGFCNLVGSGLKIKVWNPSKIEPLCAVFIDKSDNTVFYPVYLMSDSDLGFSLRLDPNPGKAHLDTNICRYC